MACLLAAFWTLGEAAPTTGTIAGVVKDSIGFPLPGVLVQVVPRSGPRLTTVTRENGAFRVNGVPAGSVGVIYSLSMFTTVRQHRIVVGAAGADALLTTMSVSPICECMAGEPPPRFPKPSELTLDARLDTPLPTLAPDALRAGEVPLYFEWWDGAVTLAIDTGQVPDLAARLIDEVDRHGFDAIGFYRQSKNSDLWHQLKTDGWQLRLAQGSDGAPVDVSIGLIRYDDLWLRARILSGAEIFREMRLRSFSGGMAAPLLAVSQLTVTR